MELYSVGPYLCVFLFSIYDDDNDDDYDEDYDDNVGWSSRLIGEAWPRSSARPRSLFASPSGGGDFGDDIEARPWPSARRGAVEC